MIITETTYIELIPLICTMETILIQIINNCHKNTVDFTSGTLLRVALSKSPCSKYSPKTNSATYGQTNQQTNHLLISHKTKDEANYHSDTAILAISEKSVYILFPAGVALSPYMEVTNAITFTKLT